MRGRPDRLFLLIGAAQGFALAAGLPAVVWWVVELRFPPLRLALLGTALVLTILPRRACWPTSTAASGRSWPPSP